MKAVLSEFTEFTEHLLRDDTPSRSLCFGLSSTLEVFVELGASENVVVALSHKDKYKLAPWRFIDRSIESGGTKISRSICFDSQCRTRVDFCNFCLQIFKFFEPNRTFLSLIIHFTV